MPARSKSQQRLFGMVHAYQKGKLKDAPEEVKNIARSISSEDAEHFAKTKHKGLPEKKAYAQGFMDKCAELGVSPDYLAKSAMAPGTTKLKTVQQLVNAAIRQRKATKGAGQLSDDLASRIAGTVKKVPVAEGRNKTWAIVYDGIEGAPKFRAYRGSGLPDMSSRGYTSSTRVRNIGKNLRHITPDPEYASAYGDGLIEIYNAKKVPGLMTGKLQFGPSQWAQSVTRQFADYDNLFRHEIEGRRLANRGLSPRQIRSARKKALGSRNSGESWHQDKLHGAILDGGLGDISHNPYNGDTYYSAWESLIDANKVIPSRAVLRGAGGTSGYDVTAFRDYAFRQKMKLPDWFDLQGLVDNAPGWWKGLTGPQIRAAERYRAVYDLVRALGGR